MSAEQIAIFVGSVVAVVGGILLSNIQGYYMARKELVEGYLEGKGRDLEKLIRRCGQKYRHSWFSAILDIGPRLALKRFQAGEFSALIGKQIIK